MKSEIVGRKTIKVWCWDEVGFEWVDWQVPASKLVPEDDHDKMLLVDNWIYGEVSQGSPDGMSTYGLKTMRTKGGVLCAMGRFGQDKLTILIVEDDATKDRLNALLTDETFLEESNRWGELAKKAIKEAI